MNAFTACANALLLVFGLAFLSANAWADDAASVKAAAPAATSTTTSTPTSKPSAKPAAAPISRPVSIATTSPSDSVLKVALVLIGLLALIALLAWLANKLQRARFLTSPGHIKAISVLPLGVKEKIAVIEVGSEQLVVGVTPQQITLLSKLETPIVADHAGAKLSGAFAQTLKKAMGAQK